MTVLKNCEHELSYIPAKLIDMCLKESCFPDCWKFLSVAPVFENVGENSAVEKRRLVSFLFLVHSLKNF